MPDSSVKGWDRSFLEAIGLGDLRAEQIGTEVGNMGEACGEGLTASAAAELGLSQGTSVGVGIIDAHAGGLGVLGARLPSKDGSEAEEVNLESRLALIAGTSCCHMASSKEPVFVPGVWGPYYSAMIPGLFLNEGGQSTAGKLLDHITTTHHAASDLEAQASAQGLSRYEFLNEYILVLAKNEKIPPRKAGLLAKNLHVLPDFFGNRSPLADPFMRGAVVGLSLSATLDDLALLYLATVQSLAYQTKHILDAMTEAGHPPINTIFVTGGLSKNPLYLETHADATGCTLVLPREEDAVLLGSAVLGARAGLAFPDIPAAMAAMNAVGEMVPPFQLDGDDGAADRSLPCLHECKYAVFRRMNDDQLWYRETMGQVEV